MNEDFNAPGQMQAENPTLGYFFGDPADPSLDVQVDANAATLLKGFAEGLIRSLGSEVAAKSKTIPIVNSEDLEEEDYSQVGNENLSEQVLTESLSGNEEDDVPDEEPIVVFPSHSCVYFPGQYFTNKDDAEAKLAYFKASPEGKQFSDWVVERDSEVYATNEPLPKLEELVAEEVEEVKESIFDPSIMANRTVMAYCHLINSLAQPLWSTGRGHGVKVAVLDTGLDLTNALLMRGSMGGVSYVPGRRSYMDDNGHGTHVTGIIASRPGIHSSGLPLYWSIAPSARHYTIKVLNRRGSGSWSAIARGIDRARILGVDIINMSLGGSFQPPSFVQRAIRRASVSQVIVASAGNSGPRPNTVGWPARYREVIGVGAIDCRRRIASFSSRGPLNPSAYVEDHVECVAPGVDIYSNALGQGARRLRKLSGTSMAAPVVSGICALLKQKDRRLVGTSSFRYRLRRSYIDLGINGPDNWYGIGQAFFHPRS